MATVRLKCQVFIIVIAAVLSAAGLWEESNSDVQQKSLCVAAAHLPNSSVSLSYFSLPHNRLAVPTCGSVCVWRFNRVGLWDVLTGAVPK